MVVTGRDADGGFIDKVYTRNKKIDISALICIFIALGFVAIGPEVALSNWVSSSDFHSCIKIVGSLFALLAGGACLVYFFALKDSFYLVVGLGFLIGGSEDLVHGILSWSRLFEDVKVDLSRFVPATYAGGRIALALMIIAAPFSERLVKKVASEKREVYILSGLALLLGGGITGLAFMLPLPQFIFAEKLISRPVDFFSAILFLIAFFLILRRYLAQGNIFCGMLLASILFNVGGQIYISFSKNLYDIFFDVAHWANVFGYAMPILGVAIQGLKEIERSKIEVVRHEQIEEVLQKAKEEVEVKVTESTADLRDVNNQLQQEIIERKMAEERQTELLKEVASINRELREFAHIVSHDLKAPLRGIRSVANWISTDYADKLGEDGKEKVNLLVSKVKQMHDLIDGVLRYSKVGRVEEEKIQVNLNELVPKVIDTIAPPENIEITIENQLPIVECDETRIVQVFQNLLSNAAKYMDKPKGQIRVGCVEEDGFWKFSVADNGPGIEEKHFEKIFRIFQTLSPHDEFESTGVGLTVTKKIVELYKGKIWVESKPGEGSTFFFTLPKQERGVKDDAKLKEANIVC